jgi:hypothetical protein
MELKTFVAEALRQIIDGVKDAQAGDDGDLINASGFPSSAASENLARAAGGGCFTKVSFDVAVAAETAGRGKGSLEVFSVGIAGGAEHKTGYVNRLSFAVPILLPQKVAPESV